MSRSLSRVGLSILVLFGLRCTPEDRDGAAPGAPVDGQPRGPSPAKPGDRATALAHLETARELYKQGKKLEALAELGQALEKDPSCYEARWVRITLCQEEGKTLNLKKALEDLEVAAALRPDEPEVLAATGIVLFRSGRSADARKPLQRYLDVTSLYSDPRRSAAVLQTLGDIALRDDDTDSAGRYLHQSRELSGQMPEVLFSLARYEGMVENAAGKERWLREALALDPFHLAARYELFLLLSRSGRKEEADQHERIYSLLRPIQDDISNYHDEHPEEAVAIWEGLVEELPAVAECKVKLLGALYSARRFERLAELGTTWLPAGLQHPDAISHTALALAHGKRFDEARTVASRLSFAVPPARPEQLRGVLAEIARIEQQGSDPARWP